MAYKIGQDWCIAVSKESVRGTAETPAAGEWIGWGEFDISTQQSNGEIEVGIGAIHVRETMKVLHRSAEVTLKVPLERVFVGHVLQGVFKGLTTSADTPEVGVHTHDWAITQSNQPDSYTISFYDGATGFRFVNAIVKSVSINLPTAENLELEVTFAAKKRELGVGAFTPSYPTTSYFTNCQVNLKEAATYAALSGASDSDVKNLTVTFERDVDHTDLQFLGDPDCAPDDFIAKSWDMTVEYETVFESTTPDHWNHSQDLDTRAFEINIVDADTTIGAATNPSIQFQFPAAKKDEYDLEIGLKDVTAEKFKIMPVYEDKTNGFALAQLVTDISTY